MSPSLNLPPSHRNQDAVTHKVLKGTHYVVQIDLPSTVLEAEDDQVQLQIGGDAKAVFDLALSEFQQVVNCLVGAHKEITENK